MLLYITTAALTWRFPAFVSPPTRASTRFPPDHYAVSVLRFFLVITITLLFAVINFPMLTALDSVSLGLAAPSPSHNLNPNRNPNLLHHAHRPRLGDPIRVTPQP